ncbi:hypothetical protein [Streptomyces scabiei]|nr:hypothetical protein [Streptomyces scabiei]
MVAELPGESLTARLPGSRVPAGHMPFEGAVATVEPDSIAALHAKG